MSFLGAGPGKILMPPPGGSLDYSQLNPATQGLLVGPTNRIINGDCRVNQQATVTVASPAGTNLTAYGGPDRYRASNSAGGSFTQARAGGFNYGGWPRFSCLQTVVTNMTDNSGSNSWSGICQPTEGLNTYDLKGQPVTVGFLFQSSLAGNFTCAVRDGTGTISCLFQVAYPTAGVVVPYVFTTPAVPTSAILPATTAQGMVVNIGASNTGSLMLGAASAGQWAAGNYLVLSNGQANFGLGGVGAFIQVSELTIIPGLMLPPFEHRHIGLEMMLCQRYYQILFGNIVSGYTGAGGAIYTDFNFPVPMRASSVPPPALLGAATYSNATNYNFSGGYTTTYLRASVVITALGYGFGYCGSGIGLNAEL